MTQYLRVNVSPGLVEVGGQPIRLEPTTDLTLHPGVNVGTIDVQTWWGPETFTYHVVVPEAGQ